MKICSQCKMENPSSATFCMRCGILLNAELPLVHSGMVVIITASAEDMNNKGKTLAKP